MLTTGLKDRGIEPVVFVGIELNWKPLFYLNLNINQSPLLNRNVIFRRSTPFQ